jgi:hypothetical protein
LGGAFTIGQSKHFATQNGPGVCQAHVPTHIRVGLTTRSYIFCYDLGWKASGRTKKGGLGGWARQLKTRTKKALASFFRRKKKEHKEAGTAKQGTEQSL